jgi:hypothetical protein
MTPNHRLVSWLLVASLTAALTAVTTVQALRRYHELRTGWSWDLAYYNQWFWSLTQADGQLSVRPVASYAEEGPSVWKGDRHVEIYPELSFPFLRYDARL